MGYKTMSVHLLSVSSVIALVQLFLCLSICYFSNVYVFSTSTDIIMCWLFTICWEVSVVCLPTQLQLPVCLLLIDISVR